MKVVFILHNVEKSLGIEWLVTGLLQNGFELSAILMNPGISEMEYFLQSNAIPVTRFYFPKRIQKHLYFFAVRRELRRIRPDVVHTHLRDADLFGHLAAFFCRVKKRVYTRHSSTFNHLYHKKSVLVDRLVNSLATDIIAISQVTKNVLVQMEHVNEAKVTLIHHGFDLPAFKLVEDHRVNHTKEKYKLLGKPLIVGMIARYTKWKGYQYAIPAFGRLKKMFPEMHFVFANTAGEYGPQIKRLLNEFLPPESYTEIRFENDIQALYKVFNLYVHVPIDDTVEAFGQTYVEALAAGIPSVFTLSGVANEFIKHEKNALVAGFKSSDGIVDAVTRLIRDPQLRDGIIRSGLDDVQQFGLKPFIEKTIHLYRAMPLANYTHELPVL